ncbi:MAG TPA: hypothetical protein VGE07_07495 [Herpetosiphonaceae bacterium]
MTHTELLEHLCILAEQVETANRAVSSILYDLVSIVENGFEMAFADESQRFVAELSGFPPAPVGRQN